MSAVIFLNAEIVLDQGSSHIAGTASGPDFRQGLAAHYSPAAGSIALLAEQLAAPVVLTSTWGIPDPRDLLRRCGLSAPFHKTWRTTVTPPFSVGSAGPTEYIGYSPAELERLPMQVISARPAERARPSPITAWLKDNAPTAIAVVIDRPGIEAPSKSISVALQVGARLTEEAIADIGARVHRRG